MERFFLKSTASFFMTLLLAMLLPLLPTKAGDAETMKKFEGFYKNLKSYTNKFYQEKVYVHLDNNGYFPGEKIWFKAYVYGAASLLPTDMSKVLYVELLTPDGSVFQRKTLPIYNGRTYGEFELKDIVCTGFYEVRAYTRAMMNWDGDIAFSRTIPVFEQPKDTLNTTVLTMNPPAEFLSNFMNRKLPQPQIEKFSATTKNYILNFYPEGGNIIKGVENQVAYKLTDEKGMPLDTKFNVYTSDGKQVAYTQPEHEGMGSFMLPADWQGGYARFFDNKGKEQRFNLPTPIGNGCQMRVNVDQSNGMTVRILPNDSCRNQILGISVTCRGDLCYFDTIHTDRSIIEKQIPRLQLKDGVDQVTIFTEEGKVLSERLTWVQPLTQPIKLTVQQNQKKYDPFSPIALDFELKDNNGNPLRGDFSLSVQDQNGMVAADGTDMLTEMLLCSDLRGYVHQPEYYFKFKNDVLLHQLDLLMMVQGWRRYAWQEMSGVDSFVVKQPAETSQIIDGRVIDVWKRQPLVGYDVNLILIHYGKYRTYKYATTKTDSDGRFYMKYDGELYDDMEAYLSVTQQDKRRKCFIVLNRQFKPQPRTYDPQEIVLVPPEMEKQENSVFDLKPFVDTLKAPDKIHQLPPAKVQEKKLLVSPYGPRYTYLGGEEYGRRHSSIYYNLEEELQNCLDKGFFVPDIADWILSINNNFERDYSVTNNDKDPFRGLTYLGHPLRFYIDNRSSSSYLAINNEPNTAVGGDMSEFRAMYISSEDFLLNNPSDIPEPITVLLYSEVGNYFLNTFKKGQRTTIIHGFSRPDEFYSPNYRTKDLPEASDHRRTLYWNPSMTTDENGKASVLLFNNSFDGTRIHINAQGIAVNGAIFRNK